MQFQFQKYVLKFNSTVSLIFKKLERIFQLYESVKALPSELSASALLGCLRIFPPVEGLSPPFALRFPKGSIANDTVAM